MAHSYQLLLSGMVARDDGIWISPDDPNDPNRPEYLAWVAAGNTPTATRRLISKATIIDRLHVAGKLAAAYAALNAADLYTQQRWLVRESIYSDDETAIALISAVGADPVAILAPE